MDELAERGLLEAIGEAGGEPPAELLDRLQGQAEEIGRLKVELALAQRKLERDHQRARARRP